MTLCPMSQFASVVSKWGPWDEAPSIEKRFKPLKGAMLQRKAKEYYVIPGFESWSATWHLPDGRPRFVEHPLNVRGLETTVDEYMSIIKRKGIYENLRSSMVVVPVGSSVVDWKDGQLGCLAGWTLSQAMYRCCECPTASKNENVIFTKETPMTAIMVLDPRTPPDALSYFVDLGNELNGVGVKQTHIQRYLKCTPISEAWLKRPKDKTSPGKRKKTTRGKASQAGMETEYKEFIDDEFGGVFAKYAHFDVARNTFNKMNATKTWEDYQYFCRHYCKFSDTSMDQTNLLYTNFEIVKKLEQNTEWHSLIVPLLSLAVSTSKQYGLPWIFKKAADRRKVENLFHEMSHTKLFTQTEGLQTDIQIGSTTRKVLLIDDVKAAVESALETVEETKVDRIFVSWALAACFVLCLEGSVDLPANLVNSSRPKSSPKAKAKAKAKTRAKRARTSEEAPQDDKGGEVEADEEEEDDPDSENADNTNVITYKLWRNLRPVIQRVVAHHHGVDHAESESQPQQEAHPKENTEDTQAATAQEGGVADPLDSLNAYVDADPKFIDKLANFLKANKPGTEMTKARRTHPALASASAHIWASLELEEAGPAGDGGEAADPVTKIIDICGEAIWSSVEPTFVKFMHELAQLIEKTDIATLLSDCPRLFKLIQMFPDRAAVHDVLAMRAKYTLVLLNDMAKELGGQVTNLKTALHVLGLDGVWQNVYVCDGAALTQEQWTKTWEKMSSSALIFKDVDTTPARTEEDWTKERNLIKMSVSSMKVDTLRAKTLELGFDGDAEDLAKMTKTVLAPKYIEKKIIQLREQEAATQGTFKDNVDVFGKMIFDKDPQTPPDPNAPNVGDDHNKSD
eukprot:1021844-Pyramimonas_sp.AAC.1